MTRNELPERSLPAVPSPTSLDRPVRFEPFPADITERAFILWSTTGRSGARVERLLAREYGADVAIPTAGTVNRWASAYAWAARADGEVLRTRGRSLRELRAGLLAAVLLGKDTVLDAMSGGLDGLAPSEAAIRLKAAELALRTAERSGLLTLLTDASETPEEGVDDRTLSVSERSRRMRELISQGNGRG